MIKIIRISFASGGFALANSMGLPVVDTGLAVHSLEFAEESVANNLIDKLEHNGLWFAIEIFNRI